MAFRSLKKRTKKRRHAAKALVDYLAGEPGSQEAYQMVQLWRNWDSVMGPLAQLAKPLGRRKKILLVGVEDSALQMEVTYYGPQMVDNANAFLEEKIFDKVQAELLMGKTPLNDASLQRVLPKRKTPAKPLFLGEAGNRMEPDSAVARSYEAYVRFFAARKKISNGTIRANTQEEEGR